MSDIAQVSPALERAPGRQEDESEARGGRRAGEGEIGGESDVVASSWASRCNLPFLTV